MESMGVFSGCGCKEVYRFPHITYPTPLVSALFAAASLLFVHLKKFFSFFYIYSVHVRVYIIYTVHI